MLFIIPITCVAERDRLERVEALVVVVVPEAGVVAAPEQRVVVQLVDGGHAVARQVLGRQVLQPLKGLLSKDFVAHRFERSI